MVAQNPWLWEHGAEHTTSICLVDSDTEAQPRE